MEAMQAEIVTDPLQASDLRNDLKANIRRMTAMGVREVGLLFGYAWGQHVYEKEWKELSVSPEEVHALVRRAEKQGYGRIGDDNLYLTVEKFNLRLQYSHEADIHLSFGTPNPLVRDIIERWTTQQWLCYTRNPALKKFKDRL